MQSHDALLLRIFEFLHDDAGVKGILTFDKDPHYLHESEEIELSIRTYFVEQGWFIAPSDIHGHRLGLFPAP